MDTYLVYYDETGDDGVTTASSDFFILTGLYMSAATWQSNFDKIKAMRVLLKERYGFHISEEMHTKNFLCDKGYFHSCAWDTAQRQEIIKVFTRCIAELDVKFVNVIIDKTRFVDKNYKVLEKALTYNIQRIENDSSGKWNFLIFTDQGRVAPMRKTARAIRAYNPIQSKYSPEFINQPINNLIEDIIEKESRESYFIQICDFISYFVHLYYKVQYKKMALPNRVGRVVDSELIKNVLETLKRSGVLNLKASGNNSYGLVIYPK